MAHTAQPPIGTDRESLISIVLGAIVVIIIGALAFRYFASRGTTPNLTETPTEGTEDQNIVEIQELPSEVQLEEENGQQVPANLPAAYTVQEGDSTWRIAQAFYGSGFNFVDIEKANGLASEQALVPGMKLTIPRVPVRGADQAGVNMDTVTAQEEEVPAVQEDRPTKGDDTQAEATLAE